MDRPVRVGHVLANAADRAAGPAYSVPRLVRALVERGHQGCVSSLQPGPESWPFPGVAHHTYAASPMMGRLGVSQPMLEGLKAHALTLDVLHSHGMWLMPNIYPAWAVRGKPCRLVISPRGMLAPGALQFSARKKDLVWSLWQKEAVEAAHCLHATSDLERDELRALGLRNPIAVIPNGVDLPASVLRRPRARRQLLFLSRIHRKKGIDFLLQSWKVIEGDFPDWDLVIAGADFGDLPAMRALATSLGVSRVHFPGPVYGQAKADLFASSELFVLPTRSENFGLVVAEALAHGLPAIVSKGAPWAGLEVHGCGRWIDLDTGALTTALRDLMKQSPAVLSEMGTRGRLWVTAEFGWQAIAQAMASVYRWLVGGGERPDCVS